jgi:hypothetical protein
MDARKRAAFGALSLAICLAEFSLSAGSAHAVRFPDTADLKKSWTVAERNEGRMTRLFRKRNGDSLAVHLRWGASGIAEVRLDQPDEIAPDSFAALTQEYGDGAAWHETMGKLDSATVAMYPGLEQEWTLQGFGGERGWLGSGLERGRYFLVFRADPPRLRTPAAGPLRLSPALFAFLDTSSEWLHVPCTDMPGEARGGAADGKNRKEPRPLCFSPGDDPHWMVRVDRRSPLAVQAWLDEQGSPALAEMRQAVASVPDASQQEYARDLSQMLLGEGQMFLVKLAQRLPAAFTWPSWQIQDLKAGQVPFAEFLPLVRRQVPPGEFLTAFRSEDAALRIRVDLYYRGTFHLTAESKP